MDSNAADQARSAPVLRQASALADWLGPDGRSLTPGGVLRKPDLPDAADALGITVPAKLRTAADIRELNRPWSFGVGAGLTQIAGGKATTGDVNVDQLPDDQLLDLWLAGVRALCTAETPKRAHPDSVLLLVLTVLNVLAGETFIEDLPAGLPLWQTVAMSAYFVADRYGRDGSYMPLSQYRESDRTGAEPDGLVPLLASLGVAAGTVRALRLTDLGRWARHHLAAHLPAAVDPAVPAADMITAAARFSDGRARRHVASDWLRAREPATAVREILRAAKPLSSSERIVAVCLAPSLSDDVIPAWREMLSEPAIGPHAQMALWNLDQIEDLPEPDAYWLAVEHAADEAAKGKPDEALTRLWLHLPDETAEGCLARAAATGHPEADAVVTAVSEFMASGVPRGIDQAVQLKVALKGWRPPVWRRVRLPAVASLRDLHFVIQTLFGWDGDHLYVFTVGGKRYSGGFYHLEETGYDDELRLGTVMSSAKKFEYEYDLGASWIHEITLEKTLPLDPDRPVACTAFSGDNPVEYPDYDWDDDEDEEPEPAPFDLDQVNRWLAGEED